MMDINAILAMAKPLVEFTFDKLMDVYGNVPYLKPNGAKGSEFKVVDEGIPCRLSRDKRQNTVQAEGNLNTNSHLLFCGPDVEVLPGSKLVINGEKYESTEVAMEYPSHQEIMVNKYEWV